MRRVMLLIPILFACGKSETPAADTAAAAAVAAPSAPAALTEADVAGKWAGVTKMAAPDTGSAKWALDCAAGTCKGTVEGQKDPITFTYVLSADSSVGTGTPVMDPMRKVKVVDHNVARFKDGKVMGNGWNTLADKPDSVVSRYTFEGSRAP